MVRNADLALYAAKGAGRGKHCFYEAAMHSEASDRQVLENDLRQALERGEIWVAYQPIVRAAGEEVSRLRGAGALEPPGARPDRPRQVHPAGRGMRDDRQDRPVRAAHRARPKRPAGPTACASRSICRRSSSTIRRSSTIVGATIAETKIRAERVELEITEGVFLADSDATDVTFARLEGARRAARARRFRHRLFVARLFEEGAVRQDQDRPELRPRRGRRRPTATARSSAPSSPSPTASAWTPPPRASRPTTICN